MALDPAFDRNGFMYLYYSPEGPKSINRLSRFTIKAEKLDLKSEKIMLEVPVVRACCHSGGSLAFGPGGNLFLSLGDDTNPFESSGFAPTAPSSTASMTGRAQCGRMSGPRTGNMA